MNNVFERISEYGIVPLVTIEDEADSIPVAKALVNGGIPIAEVTFRTPIASKVINHMAKNVPDLIVGAGTVHTIDQVKATIDNGGQFIITPGVNEKVIDYCVKNNIPICPGVVTPSEIELALNYELKILKFFPAEAYGGVKTLKALKGPYSDIKFVPTGGVGLNNLREYLNLPNVAAVGGSFIPPANLIKAKDFEGIAKECQKILDIVFNFNVGHIGINATSEDAARAIDSKLTEIFNTSSKDYKCSIFNGNIAEIMKVPAVGFHGHICIDTDDLFRALALVRRNNISIDENSYVYDENGKLLTVFLKDEISGFAVHIRRRKV